MKAHFITARAAVLAATHGKAATFRDGYPFAVGDTFTFHYTSEQSIQSGCTGKPTVTRQSYPEVTTILPEVNYSLPSGRVVKAYPFQTKATATTSAGALTVNDIDYRNFVTSGKDTDYVDYGYSEVSDLVESPQVTKHLSETRVWLTPVLRDQIPRIVAKVLPFPVTFKQVNDDYDQTSMQSNIYSGTQIRQTDGSLTFNGLSFDVPYAVVQKSDGTGTETVGPSTAPELYSFQRPQPSASGEIIPVVVTFAGKTGTNDVPDWFPGHGAPPSPLATSFFVDRGTQPVPAHCGGHAGKPATHLHMSYSTVDPVVGDTYKQTDDYYFIKNLGRVCIEVTQITTDYDAQVTGQCSQIKTLHYTEGLMSKSIH